MFGFLRPDCGHLRYRSVYSRCCQHLKAQYGVRSLPFHSYESVFLYACALDAGHVPAAVIREQWCCRLRGERDLHRAADADFGRFLGAITLTLADIKLADDVTDHRSWMAKVYRRVLKSKIRNAHHVLSQADPALGGKISGWLREHADLEARGEPIELDEYCTPTAEAFAHVFGLAGQVASSPGFTCQVQDIFRQVGAALIAFDCASDWWEDRISGSFNPLKDASDIPRAYDYAADRLDGALSRCETDFGAEALSSAILASVVERVRTLAGRAARSLAEIPSGVSSCANSARRIGNEMGAPLTKPGYLYADCGGSFGVCLACACCAAVISSGCNQNQQANPGCGQPRRQNTGCGAQNQRPICPGCGCTEPTTHVCGPCEISNNQAGASCCRACCNAYR